jgi:mannose-6-phosphate isomerase-like protein (cupin superfamily)
MPSISESWATPTLPAVRNGYCRSIHHDRYARSSRSGPPPHRHDFEETFILLDGELQATFRGEKRIVRAGETVNIPANAPHQFHNASSKPVRMLCICSSAGYEEFFKEVGTAVATRTTPPPKVDAAQEAAFIKKVIELAPKYRTELLREAK